MSLFIVLPNWISRLNQLIDSLKVKIMHLEGRCSVYESFNNETSQATKHTKKQDNKKCHSFL